MVIVLTAGVTTVSATAGPKEASRIRGPPAGDQVSYVFQNRKPEHGDPSCPFLGALPQRKGQPHPQRAQGPGPIHRGRGDACKSLNG